MTAKNIRNVSDRSFTGIGGVTLKPGSAMRVEKWSAVEDSDMVRSWVAAGMLVVEDATARSTKETGPSEEEAEAARLAAERKGAREDEKLTEIVGEQVAKGSKK